MSIIIAVLGFVILFLCSLSGGRKGGYMYDDDDVRVPYEKFEFCKHIGCNEWRKKAGERSCATRCTASAYKFHDYLNQMGYFIEKEDFF